MPFFSTVVAFVTDNTAALADGCIDLDQHLLGQHRYELRRLKAALTEAQDWSSLMEAEERRLQDRLDRTSEEVGVLQLLLEARVTDHQRDVAHNELMELQLHALSVGQVWPVVENAAIRHARGAQGRSAQRAHDSYVAVARSRAELDAAVQAKEQLAEQLVSARSKRELFRTQELLPMVANVGVLEEQVRVIEARLDC